VGLGASFIKDDAVEYRLRRASQWLFQPEPSARHLPLQVLSDDPFTFSSIFNHNHMDKSASAIYAYLLRIDTSDLEDNPNEDRVASIVTYNYGISYLCQAKLSATADNHSKLLENAFKVFRVAHNFLALCPYDDPFALTVRLLLESTLVQHYADLMLMTPPARNNVAANASTSISSLLEHWQAFHQFMLQGNTNTNGKDEATNCGGVLSIAPAA
jgi:hypothetical protein